jgi:hypothetical protein
MKRRKIYYEMILFHLFSQTIWNSNVLCSKNGGLKNHLQFRIELAEPVTQKHHLKDGNSKLLRPGIEPKSLRLTDQHFPEFIPPTNKKERLAKQQAVQKEMPCDSI